MSEKKRFVQSKYAHHLQDTETDTHYYLTSEKIGCKDLFDEIERLTEENKQLRKYNKQLKERLEKINGGYGHLTHRKGLTANEWLIESQEKELKNKNEQISDWIERHSKDIAKICEQQAIISDLKEEIEQLKNDVHDCDFILLQDDFGNYEIRYDDDDEVFHFLWEVAPILNKQQAIIQSLKEEVNKLNEELYYCEKFRYQVFQGLSELNGD